MVQGIQKRTHKNKTISCRVHIRDNDGLPSKSKSFPTLQEAKDWQKEEKVVEGNSFYNTYRVRKIMPHYEDQKKQSYRNGLRVS